MLRSESLINDKPFSGTGFGYNPATGELNLKLVLDLTNANQQYKQYLTTETDLTKLPASATLFNSALLPNMPLTAYTNSPDTLINNIPGTIPGGANEDYDAADYQNMVLAAQIGNATIPSLHRPALVNYWYNDLVNDPNGNNYEATFWNKLGLTTAQKLAALMYPYGRDCKSGTADDNADWPFNKTMADKIVAFKRIIIMRSLQEDHPDFTGSNINPSGFDPINGPWDVDNDGDGVPDSIWVDLGMPVRAAKDGRLYKPLFAILCVDMDGRLNLNAHGSLAQTDPGYYPAAGTSPDPAFPDRYFASHTSLPTNRGRGFGPADINLLPILGNNPLDTRLYQNLLGVHWEDTTDRARPLPDTSLTPGNLRLGLEGRYGELELLTPGTNPTVLPKPGAQGTPYFTEIPTATTPTPIDPNQNSYNDYLSRQ